MKALMNNTSMNNSNPTSMHQHHDHSSHQMASNSQHNLHDGMIMSFHGGYDEVILFDFWNTNKSIPLFLLSCLALFVMAILYEGLKLAREKLIRRELLERQSNRAAPFSSSTCHCNKSKKNNHQINGEANNLLLNDQNGNGNTISNGLEDEVAILSGKHECCSKKNNTNQEIITISKNNRELTVKSYSSRLLSQGHVIQTLLHMLQITISYLLMLVFMTYNSWLCLSVVLGAGVGYFLFGLQRIASIDVNEHCH